MKTEPTTDREKQIAREAAKQAWNEHTPNRAPTWQRNVPEDRSFTIAERAACIAITAAKQEWNEDTLRLDWLNEYGRIRKGGFPEWSITTVEIPADVRAAIDAARGVQPAAKETVGQMIRAEVEAHEAAMKQESAPAAEQFWISTSEIGCLQKALQLLPKRPRGKV